MKRIFSCIILFMGIFSIVACDKEKDISYDQLPVQSQSMISTYFPGATVTKAKKEKGDHVPYEVYLSDGTHIDFDKNGEWDEIDGNGRPLPEKVLELLPSAIRSYLDENYAGFQVVKIDKEYNRFEVELNDGTELHFDQDGRFLRVDEQGTGIPSGNSNNYESLPQPAKDFLNTHYSGINVVRVKYDAPDSTPYEVGLGNGTEIDFDGNGTWQDIDGNRQALPASITGLLPQGITGYVSQNYPGQSIVKIDKERATIEVELQNDIELVFNTDGTFIRIDY